MTKSIKPNCFIAMAFEHDDTDALYENQILPVLKRNNVTPIIINRRQSNDDLNIQIIEQLEIANFCITDLTYARPSVYYEAGYAQRKIPVIYTVRKDHLNPGQPENLRVHFDLQMKPLIKWKNPEDQSFSRQLESRIKATFLNQWDRNLESKIKLEVAVSEFEKETVSKRLIAIRNLSISKLRKIGFSNATWGLNRNHYFDRFTYERESITNGYVNYVSAILRKGKNVHYVSVQSFSSLTVNILEEIYDWDAEKVAHDIRNLKSDEHLGIANNIVLSLKPITPYQIEKVFTGLKPVSRGNCYRGISNSILRDFSVFSSYYFLTGIKSPLHLEEPINEIIEHINELMINNERPKL